MRARTDVEAANQTWNHTKIRLLIDGEILRDDQEIEAPSAYEIRQRALDGGDHYDQLLDVIQLQQAVSLIADDEVREAMQLRMDEYADEWEIELRLQSNRSGRNLLDRGCELVRRNERGTASRRRLESDAKRERFDQPRCWQCRNHTVTTAGDKCDTCTNPPAKRGRPEGTIVPVAKRGLKWLIATQQNADNHMPGGREEKDHTMLRGDMDKPAWIDGYVNLGNGGRSRIEHKNAD